MRWSYKTVLYELKKEGLLGSAFLDESEIELSLNEFGAAGWDLVSMLETRDGIIAVFKQPIGLAVTRHVEEEEDLHEAAPSQPSPSREDGTVVRERQPVIRTKEEVEDKKEQITGIGSIRIE